MALEAPLVVTQELFLTVCKLRDIGLFIGWCSGSCGVGGVESARRFHKCCHFAAIFMAGLHHALQFIMLNDESVLESFYVL